MKQNDPLRVYISGAISSDKDAKLKFEMASQQLRALGFTVINPFELTEGIALSWTDYLRVDIKALMDCDAIVSLDGWIVSRGGRIERTLAGELALLIFEGVEGARFWLQVQRKWKAA